MLDEALELVFLESAKIFEGPSLAEKAESGMRFQRGTALEKLERIDEAVLEFEQAAKLNPVDTFAKTKAAQLMSEVEEPRYAEALAVYDALISAHAPHGFRKNGTPRGNTYLEPAKANYFARANVYMKLERWEEAIKGFDQAIAIDQSFTEAKKNRELALGKAGKAEL